MTSRQRPPPAAPSRGAGYATPMRRPTAASPSSSTSHQRAATMRTPLSSMRRANGTPPPSTVRRKPRPQWNEYLTDDTQYRLTQERQLVRHMQQLSAAHFHARSPARRRELASRDPKSTDSSSDSPTSDYSDTRADTVGDTVQGELSRLEGMLSDLEHESAFLEDAGVAVEVQGGYEDSYHQSGYANGGEHEQEDDIQRSQREELENERGHGEQGSDEPYAEEEEETSAVGFDDPVASICFKSLRIGIDLTQKMQQLAKELDHERRHRKRHERRIVELEQQCQATETRCRVVEAQYEDVSSQLDGMRDAMIATEEAIHRLTQELIRSRHPGSTPQRRPSSPSLQRQKRAEEAVAHSDVDRAAGSEEDSQTDKENRHVTLAGSHQGGYVGWST